MTKQQLILHEVMQVILVPVGCFERRVHATTFPVGVRTAEVTAAAGDGKPEQIPEAANRLAKPGVSRGVVLEIKISAREGTSRVAHQFSFNTYSIARF